MGGSKGGLWKDLGDFRSEFSGQFWSVWLAISTTGKTKKNKAQLLPTGSHSPVGKGWRGEGRWWTFRIQERGLSPGGLGEADRQALNVQEEEGEAGGSWGPLRLTLSVSPAPPSPQQLLWG